MMNQNHQRSSSKTEISIKDLPSEIHQSLSPQQLQAVQQLLDTTLTRSKPTPKLVDLRFMVDLFFARYYFVLLVGRDQRVKKRKAQSPISRVGNVMTAILLLIGLNLLVTSILILMMYLLKSAAGINLLPGHLGIPSKC